MATVAFDLNGTLMDPSALAEPLGDDDAARALVLRGLELAVVQAMALTLAGAYRPFPGLVEAGLRRELELTARDPALAADMTARLSSMAPFPDAEAALDVLDGAGHRPVVVTNSATGAAEAVLGRAGLRERFGAVVGTDEVRAFKPDGRVYAHALERLGTAAGDTWLVAAHWWDVLGAAHAGLRTAWVSRKERALVPAVAPDVRGEGLLEVAEAIVARPA